jgi:CRP-like cAMP-binding protein
MSRAAQLVELRRRIPLGDAAFAAFAPLVEPRSFAAETFLLTAGAHAEWCHLVTRGLVRELYIDEAGEEHTRSFIAEGQVTGSLLDLLSGAPSVTWIQALEPTETLAWRYRDFDALCARFPELHVVARRTAEALYVRKTRREHELLTMPASARHARWLDEHAALDARVSRRHLASYLGVTPEHLSRLRRPLRKSKRPAPTPRGNR